MQQSEKYSKEVEKMLRKKLQALAEEINSEKKNKKQREYLLYYCAVTK